MSVLEDFAGMWAYRQRASEFELLAGTEPLPRARLDYRAIAQHYKNWQTAKSEPTKLKWLSTLSC
jgi:hypothetical protein